MTQKRIDQDDTQEASAIDWEQINRNFRDEQCRDIAAWRGYSVEFVGALCDAGLIGLYRGYPAFPVQATDGEVIAVHYNFDRKRKKWAYEPGGAVTWPLVIGDISTAETGWIFESQWDAFAIMQMYGWHLPDNFLSSVAILVTRGSSNGKEANRFGANIKEILAFSQNDSVKADGRPTAADKWLTAISKNAAQPIWKVSPPAGTKDWNDLTRSGATAESINEAISNAIQISQPVLGNRGEEIAPTANSETPPATTDHLPALFLPSGKVSITECAERLFGIIAPREMLFQRHEKVMEIVLVDDGRWHLRPVTPQAFRSRMEQFAEFWVWRSGADGQPVAKPAVPSEDQAKALLESLAVALLPRIRGVLNCPVILQGDTGQVRILTSGYDPQSGLLVAEGKEIPIVPLGDAVKKLKEIHQDFDFETPSDRSRALASMITPALRLGGHLPGYIPADVAEANESQSGKTYRSKLIAAVYNEEVSLVTQKQGGVGSDDETFNEALVRGHPFILFDNRRGKLNSPHLEAFLTAKGMFPARIVRLGTFYVDPEVYFIFLSSNGVDTTPDFANRSCIVRIRKRPEGYIFKNYPEGDVLDHVRTNQPYILGCVFVVAKEWLARGKPTTDEARHDFRAWCQPLDWIIQNILGEAPLMDGHDSAQQRVSNPARGFARKIALAVEKNNRLNQELTAQEINQIANEHGIEIPNYYNNGDDAAFKIIGQHAARLFKDSPDNTVAIESYKITRSERLEPRNDGQGNFIRKVYIISRIN
jgi:hypothetical protein